MARFGLAADRGTVIFNGVAAAGGDGSAPVDLPAPLGTVPYVLALGRVVDKKGFDLLLAGYAAMDPAARTADLVIAGTGHALERLEAMAEESGLRDRVHFVGRLSREQVAAAMAGAELFVMPSRLEPFGIVVLEAWRAGTAVLATDHGGPPEFVRDGEDGLLVDPFDTVAVAAALGRVLSDGALRRSLATAGHARIDDFSWPTIAASYRALYRSVTGTAAVDVREASSSASSAETLRVGMDLISVEEVAASVDHFGDRYVKRLFTPHEIDTCRTGDCTAADATPTPSIHWRPASRRKKPWSKYFALSKCNPTGVVSKYTG